MRITRHQTVACPDHGTLLRGFLPRAWDHLVASNGTARRVVPGVLITFLSGCLQRSEATSAASTSWPEPAWPPGTPGHYGPRSPAARILASPARRLSRAATRGQRLRPSGMRWSGPGANGIITLMPSGQRPLGPDLETTPQPGNGA